MYKKDGFTLIEMVTVIAILAILAAIAVPNYIRHRDNQQVIRAARRVYSALQSAKMNAVKDNATIYIDFTAGSGAAGTYRVFEDLNDNGAFDAGTDREISGGQMPPGITMNNIGFSGDQAVFSSMGIPRETDGTLDSASVQVKNSGKCSQVGISSSGNIRIVQC